MWKFLTIALGVTLLFIMLMRDIRMALTGQRVSVSDQSVQRRRRRIRIIRLSGVGLIGVMSMGLPHYRQLILGWTSGASLPAQFLPLGVLAAIVALVWTVPRWMPDRWDW